MDAAGEEPTERISGTVVRGLCYTVNRKPSDLNDSSKLKFERREENNLMKKLYAVVTLAAVLMGGTLLL